MGSAASENAPQSGLYREEAHSAATDMLVESPSGAQLSSNSGISSGVRVNTPTEGSNESLQGMISITDNQDIMHAFPDIYTQDGSWAAGIDWCGNHSSRVLSPLEIRTVHEPGALTWPPSASHTDSELDLDIPFAVEHTGLSTGRCSNPLSELDLSQFLLGQAQGQDTTKPWGELISYLSLDEKVGARNRLMFYHGGYQRC